MTPSCSSWAFYCCFWCGLMWWNVIFWTYDNVRKCYQLPLLSHLFPHTYIRTHTTPHYAIMHYKHTVTGTGLNELQIAFVCRETLKVSIIRTFSRIQFSQLIIMCVCMCILCWRKVKSVRILKLYVSAYLHICDGVFLLCRAFSISMRETKCIEILR